jgi:hypothetical protein
MAATKELAILDRYNALAASDDDTRAMLAEVLDGETLDISDLPTITVPSGGGTSWEVPTPEGPRPTQFIEGIILSIQTQRAYWENPNPQIGTPPNCLSRDGIHGIGNPGGACGDCPLNEFGSKVGQNGQETRGKACSEKRVLYLLLPDMSMPVVLRAPAMSLKAVKNYRIALFNQKVGFDAVITKIGLEKRVNGTGQPYSALTLAMVGRIPDETRAQLKPMLAVWQGMLKQIGAPPETPAMQEMLVPDMDGEEI